MTDSWCFMKISQIRLLKDLDNLASFVVSVLYFASRWQSWLTSSSSWLFYRCLKIYEILCHLVVFPQAAKEDLFLLGKL